MTASAAAANPVAPSGRSRFLDVQALASLAHMRFTTRRQLEGAYSGRHRSRQRGGAGEFADYREYVEGEDLRRLDWKVLARTGRAYTRLFQDETNLLCTLALDASASMDFRGTDARSVSKLEYAQYLATAFAELIVRQQDQVGLAVIGESLGEWMAPGGTTSHAARLERAVETIRPAKQTGLATGLRDLYGRLTRRGVLIVISDFLVERSG